MPRRDAEVPLPTDRQLPDPRIGNERAIESVVAEDPFDRPVVRQEPLETDIDAPLAVHTIAERTMWEIRADVDEEASAATAARWRCAATYRDLIDDNVNFWRLAWWHVGHRELVSAGLIRIGWRTRNENAGAMKRRCDQRVKARAQIVVKFVAR